MQLNIWRRVSKLKQFRCSYNIRHTCGGLGVTYIALDTKNVAYLAPKKLQKNGGYGADLNRIPQGGTSTMSFNDDAELLFSLVQCCSNQTLLRQTIQCSKRGALSIVPPSRARK